MDFLHSGRFCGQGNQLQQETQNVVNKLVRESAKKFEAEFSLLEESTTIEKYRLEHKDKVIEFKTARKCDTGNTYIA